MIGTDPAIDGFVLSLPATWKVAACKKVAATVWTPASADVKVVVAGRVLVKSAVSETVPV